MRHPISTSRGVSFPLVIDGKPNGRTIPSLADGRHSTVPPLRSATVFAQPADSFDADPADAEIEVSALLPQAKWFGCDSFRVGTIADQAGSCQPGDIVVYRIGESEPNALIAEALARGAAGILTEQLLPCPLPQCIVGSVDMALAEIAAARHQTPDRNLLTVGVLGHSGKTSTCMLLASLTQAIGIRTAYQCDLGSSDGVLVDTPDRGVASGAALIEWLSESNDCCSRIALVELDDQAARSGRYDAVRFDVLIVAGRGKRSDDFGPCSLECLVERLTPAGVVIVPEDDPVSLKLLDDASVRRITYGTSPSSEFGAVVLDGSGGMSTLMLSAGDTSAMMETPLCGLPMASNIAAAAALGTLLGESLQSIAKHLSTLRTIPGRGQRLVDYGRATVVLETGGSEVRLRHALRTAKHAGGGGRLWCVLAIGDDDGANRLAGYGRTIERLAQHSVITAKPGHGETFLQASHQVLDGVKECAAVRLIADREQAIQWAVKHAGPRDTVVVVSGDRSRSAHQARADLQVIETAVAEARSWSDPVEFPATEAETEGKKVTLKLFP
jgi:UDP-N-acetylmuramoyl-L-alanyl-D-glutamate--2,6-diaminopimelate ligase